MKQILELIKEQVTEAFVACGYDAKYGFISLSNRPDLCEFQCNGAMAAAKEYKKAMQEGGQGGFDMEGFRKRQEAQTKFLKETLTEEQYKLYEEDQKKMMERFQQGGFGGGGF